MPEVRSGSSRDATRAHIVDVAAQLLREHGPDAVTTRGVAQAAGTQPPVIYRLFQDKDGLLDAVAEYVFARYVADKALAPDVGDPVADLRAAWGAHIGFHLANPGLSALFADPRRDAHSPAAIAGVDVLRSRVRRIAAIGRLRVAEERAVDLIRAAGAGAVHTLLAVPAEQRDLALAEALYDAVMGAILTDGPGLEADGATGSTAAVVAFRTVVPNLSELTDAERALLSEWLDRVAVER
jgi:AcrR family transcriptional regulator